MIFPSVPDVLTIQITLIRLLGLSHGILTDHFDYHPVRLNTPNIGSNHGGMLFA